MTAPVCKNPSCEADRPVLMLWLDREYCSHLCRQRHLFALKVAEEAGETAPETPLPAPSADEPALPRVSTPVVTGHAAWTPQDGTRVWARVQPITHPAGQIPPDVEQRVAEAIETKRLAEELVSLPPGPEPVLIVGALAMEPRSGWLARAVRKVFGCDDPEGP